MKIKSIIQLPFGTVVSLDTNVPWDGVVGRHLTVDGSEFHKVKGTPTNVWTEVLLESTQNLEVGQEVTFIETKQTV